MKINVNNTDALNSAINAAEGRATARTITASDVAYEIEQIESRLEDLLYKEDWRGLQFRVDPHAKEFLSSYKYTPESTQFIVERGSRDWFVVGIMRDLCNGPTKKVRPLNLAERAEQIARFVTKRF